MCVCVCKANETLAFLAIGSSPYKGYSLLFLGVRARLFFVFEDIPWERVLFFSIFLNLCICHLLPYPCSFFSGSGVKVEFGGTAAWLVWSSDGIYRSSFYFIFCII